ncbi:unnamed protein product [Caenorhabditis brenneri]
MEKRNDEPGIDSQRSNNIEELAQDIQDGLKISDSTPNNENGEVAAGKVVYGVFMDTFTPDKASYPVLRKNPEIVIERPLTTDDINLKCSQIRWTYRNHKDLMWFPFNGRDSLLIEIRHRLDNNMKLDDESELILNALLEDLKKENQELKASGCQRQASTSSSEGEHSDKEEKKIVPVLNSVYKVNHDNTEVKAIYWKNDSKKIRRGVYFTTDNQPIDPIEADCIQNHLRDFVKDSSESSEAIPPDLRIKENLYEWTSLFQFTVKRKNDLATPLETYSEEASWHDTYPLCCFWLQLLSFSAAVLRGVLACCTKAAAKVEHLVFVIHGVGHDGKEEGVVESAKLLTEGADAAAKKSSGILFLPIHWRSFIKLDENVPLDPEIDFGRLKKVFVDTATPDVNLYNTPHYGKKIRNLVVQKLNYLYKKFKKINPTFHGTCSIFGHSLGSVISYDILTDYSEYKEVQLSSKTSIKKLKFKVDKLFTVGSPLREFLELRDETAHKKFLETVNRLRIYNIYHPTDLVSRRLEPFADAMYEVILPLQILVPNGIVSKNPTLVVCKTFAKTIWSPMKWAYNTWRAKTRISLGVELPYRLDHQLQKNVQWRELQTHSIYWYHAGFHLFMVNALRKKERNIILKKQVSVEQTTDPEPSLVLITTKYIQNRKKKHYKIHVCAFRMNDPGSSLVLIMTTYNKNRKKKHRKIDFVHRRRRTGVTRELHKHHHNKTATMRQRKWSQSFSKEQFRKRIIRRHGSNRC